MVVFSRFASTSGTQGNKSNHECHQRQIIIWPGWWWHWLWSPAPVGFGHRPGHPAAASRWPMKAGSVSGVLLCPQCPRHCLACRGLSINQPNEWSYPIQWKTKTSLGTVFTSVDSSYVFMILISSKEPDFGLPCLRGDLTAAAIPVLCGNPKSLKWLLWVSGVGGGEREAFLREDGEEDKCWRSFV